jgi:hypothetical protein
MMFMFRYTSKPADCRSLCNNYIFATSLSPRSLVNAGPPTIFCPRQHFGYPMGVFVPLSFDAPNSDAY